MTAALIALAGGLVGVLLGGGVQVAVEERNHRAATRRAARLLYGDHLLALVAVRSFVGLAYWWSDESAPPLEDWRRYREALADKMSGRDFQTVDGAFHRVADLDRWRRARLAPDGFEGEGQEAVKQLERVGEILLRVGFKGKEHRELRSELGGYQENPWVRGDDAGGQ